MWNKISMVISIEMMLEEMIGSWEKGEMIGKEEREIRIAWQLIAWPDISFDIYLFIIESIVVIRIYERLFGHCFSVVIAKLECVRISVNTPT